MIYDFWDFVQQVETNLGACPDKLSKLSRIDQTKDYTIKNLEWAIMTTVGSRYQKTKHIRVGKIKQSLKQWEIQTGIKYCTLYNRLKRGWTPRDTVQRAPR
jgi:hypothetical protein